MGSSISAISDDIDAYLDLCKRYGEEPQTDDRGYADPYGTHAKKLEKRRDDEARPGEDMAHAQRAVESPRLCQFGDGENRDMAVKNWTPKGRLSLPVKTILDELAEVDAWLAKHGVKNSECYLDRLACWWWHWSHLKHQAAKEDPEVDTVPKIFTKAQAKEHAIESHKDWVRNIVRLGLVHKSGTESWFVDPLTGQEGTDVHVLFVGRLEAFKKAGVRPAL